MSAEAHDVLEDDLIVFVSLIQLLAIILKSEAAELAVRPVRHNRKGLRVVALGIERALRPAGARRRVRERRGVIAIRLFGVQRERLAHLGRIQQADAHGDARVPRCGLNAHEARFHGRRELGTLQLF